MQELHHLWKNLHDNYDLRHQYLNPVLKDSWERSYQFGVNHRKRENNFIGTKSELLHAQKNQEYLIKISLPIMENILFSNEDRYGLALMDTDLRMLKIMGHDDFLSSIAKVGVIEGSMWSENLVGTNSFALSLALSSPISVVGYEHFCLFAHISACASAPIIDQNQIIGILGLIAPYNKVNAHTLAMVTEVTKHIKSKMLLERTRSYHEVVMNSMSEGVIALDQNYCIAYINENCSNILKLKHHSVIGRNIFDLLSNDPDNQYLIDIISRGKPVNDEAFMLSVGKSKIRCSVTSNPIYYSDPFYQKGYLIVIRESKQVNRLVKNWIGREARMSFDNVIGNNSQFKQVVKTAKTAAASSSNILILGESGTGKDVIAQSMHSASSRRNYPFVAINCAALPRELLSSELFGYEEGAFTGAKKGGNIGKFELADHGTLFLDEIGDMPLDLQSSLLRVIEDKSIQHLGGNRLIPVNVRIIAATNKNLEEEIARNHFRHDLYYRLAIIKMTMPPLRQRKDDILLLAQYFIESICKRFEKPLMKLNPKVVDVFLNYDWPGNVRELQNILEGAIQLANGNEITYDLVQEYFVQNNQVKSSLSTKLIENKTIAEIEKQVILDCLKKHSFNKTETAEALGISRRTLYRRLKEYQLLSQV